jgi:hypothetical protein
MNKQQIKSHLKGVCNGFITNVLKTNIVGLHSIPLDVAYEIFEPSTNQKETNEEEYDFFDKNFLHQVNNPFDEDEATKIYDNLSEIIKSGKVDTIKSAQLLDITNKKPYGHFPGLNSLYDVIPDLALVKKKLENNIFVAGGCITSMILNEEVNDYDIYFSDKSIVDFIFEQMLQKFNEKNGTQWHWNNARKKFFTYKNGFLAENPPSLTELFVNWNKYVDKTVNAIYAEKGSKVEDFCPICLSSNAITLAYKETKIQVITRFTGKPEEVLSYFDFVHTNNYYSYIDNKLELNQKAVESISTKTLFYNGSKFPICSLIRANKFLKRGWEIPHIEYLKMVFQLSEFNLYDKQILEEQLIGMYSQDFIQVLEKIENLQEITFESIMKVIEDINVENN